ncbi:hypothetical protein [Pedobacter sp. Hv1]|uniref:hypothetical protein n=1 Tax=Pedobacter sp. Hv1 TaxID=1740090 RepID=UPI0006D8D1DA|nr:hypothetical protein [Pedobacter sp. Hv1]KQC00391.1 hypothetical protein AQF98_12970 [Pedobacter sp. Hv1]
MERKEVNFLKLKNNIEINDGSELKQLLKKRKNHHFYSSKVKRTSHTDFDFTGAIFSWSQDYISTPLTNVDGFQYDEIIVDLAVQVILVENSFDYSKTFRKPIILEISLHAFVFIESNLHGDINLLNQEQKSLLIFHKTYERELERSGIKMLHENTYQGQEAFSFFTRIWKNVDIEDSAMVTGSSHDYFTELNECHRKIMYSVGCSNIWGRYITHFQDNSYNFQGSKVYPVKQNYFDVRYVSYLENAIEELYTFYERLAYLIYLFLKPTSFLQFSLSYNKLFERRTKREVIERYAHLTTDANYAYFFRRINNEHKKLSTYRHPLVHYQSTNETIKGSYNASFTTKWLHHATSDESKLLKIQNEIEDIRIFVNKELNNCKVSFEHAVLLIEGLNSNI